MGADSDKPKPVNNNLYIKNILFFLDASKIRGKS